MRGLACSSTARLTATFFPSCSPRKLVMVMVPQGSVHVAQIRVGNAFSLDIRSWRFLGGCGHTLGQAQLLR